MLEVRRNKDYKLGLLLSPMAGVRENNCKADEKRPNAMDVNKVRLGNLIKKYLVSAGHL